MSLLTSSATTREQHRFFNKLQREYNKRSFLNTNYSQPRHVLHDVNENTEKVEEIIRESMQDFLEKLKNIVSSSHNSRIDFYFLLNEMKTTDFFNEVAQLLDESLVERNGRLLRENAKMKEQIKTAHQQIRDLQRGASKPQKAPSNLKFNASKSLAQNLYEKSKTMREDQFLEMCGKVMLVEKVVIKKVAEGQLYRKWDDCKVDRVEEREMLKRVDAFLERRGSLGAGEEELAGLLAQLRGLKAQKEAFQCPRPCCNAVEERISNKSKASVLRESLDSRRQSQVYQNNRAEQYFNRYYRRSEFDMHKVYSIQKTKLAEMEKMEEEYRKAAKLRKRMNRSGLQ